jgi:hypothetical protein
VERVCFLGRVGAERLAQLNGRPPDQGFQRIGEIFHLD